MRTSTQFKILLSRFNLTPSRLIYTMSIPRPYDYITAESLAEKLKSDPSNLEIVDVRDDDFVGGNIPSAINIPSNEFDDKVKGLVEQLKGVNEVVFHCSLSQQRGPKSARIYREVRDSILGEQASNQKVLVLRDGFAGFVAKYKDDPKLVENFDQEAWEWR